MSDETDDAADIAEHRSRSDDPERKDPPELLVQAVNQLAPGERDAVLAWLLRVVPSARGITPVGYEARMAQFRFAPDQFGQQLSGRLPRPGKPPAGASPGAQQMVPVRFPAEQHAQLRDWCAEHGFSMATVIRGLVARFLETQLPERN